ncbi:MAG: site-specific integrase [Rikenellaceae bacterium]
MSRTTFKVAFFIKRAALKKSGKMPIIARITINGKMAQFSTQLEVADQMWSVPLGRATGQSKESKQINDYLESIKASLINLHHEKRRVGVELSAERLKSMYLGKGDEKQTLIAAFAEHNKGVEKLVGIETTLSTYKKYELAKRRLIEFLTFQYGITDIAMSELNLNFVRNYELFLKTEKELSHNVAAKMIQFLKKIVSLAFFNGTIANNPFAPYKIRLTKVDRGYLSEEELDILLHKKIDIPRLDCIRDVFLFCCYTGLSYIDIKNLTTRNIVESSNGDLWIKTHRQKTKNPVSVLLLDVPRSILDKYRGTLPEEDVLPVLSNQKCNSYLKELADICHIDKNLTFHMSRHTFATTLTISNGVPIETVSKMLGHSSIKITQIYARITTEKINKDMKVLASKINSSNIATYAR